MPFIVEQRKPSSALPMVKDWSECLGSYSETEAEAALDIAWWQAYDAHYSQTGWEYRIRQVKQRGRAVKAN